MPTKHRTIVSRMRMEHVAEPFCSIYEFVILPDYLNITSSISKFTLSFDFFIDEFFIWIVRLIFCRDISNGREVYPIQVVGKKKYRDARSTSSQSDSDTDQLIPDFKYITKTILLQNSIQIDRRVSQMRICSCVDKWVTVLMSFVFSKPRWYKNVHIFSFIFEIVVPHKIASVVRSPFRIGTVLTDVWSVISSIMIQLWSLNAMMCAAVINCCAKIESYKKDPKLRCKFSNVTNVLKVLAFEALRKFHAEHSLLNTPAKY